MAENRQRGLLRIATNIEQQVAVDTDPRRFTMPSTGIEQSMQDLSKHFTQFGNRIGQLADAAAKDEGTEEGRLAGMDPEFRPRNDRTIRGEAFDAAGLSTYRSRISVGMAEDMEKLLAEHGDNPEALGQAFEQRRQGWRSQSIPEMHGYIDSTFQRGRIVAMRNAVREQTRRVSEEQRAALTDEVSTRVRTIQQLAFGAGLDQTADELIAVAIGELTESVSGRAADGRPMITPAQRRTLVRDVTQYVSDARLLGAFERLPDTATQEQFINRFREDFAGSRGIASSYDLNGFERISGQLNARLRSGAAADAAVAREMERELRSVSELVNQGYEPRQQIERLRAIATTSNRADFVSSVQEVENLMAFQQDMRRRAPAELEEWVRSERTRMRTEEPTSQATARVNLAERLAREARTGLQQDQIGWADRVGLLPARPLDFSTPATTMATLQRRISDAETVAAHYGTEAVYLRPPEREALARVMSAGGQATIDVASAILSTSPERGPRIMAELSDRSPVVSMIGSLVSAAGGGEERTRTPQVALDAAGGLALMRTPNYQALATRGGPSQSPRTLAWEEGGVALRGMERVEQAAIAAANAAYEFRATQQRHTTFQPDLWRRTFREVLGEHTVRGEVYGGLYHQDRTMFGAGRGGQIVVPPWIKRDSFPEVIAAIRPTDLIDPMGSQPTVGNGRPLSVEALRRGRLITVGWGQYMINMGGDDDMQLVMSGSQPYVLNLEALRPTLQARRPDLFFGGRR